MDFRLFGGVEGLVDGRSVDLGRRQERCVLGLLLIEAGRMVATDRIADLLWDGQPPETGRAVVQTYVARLRPRLRPYGVDIVSESGGYRCDAAPSTIDAHEFLRLAAEAQAAPDAAGRAKLLGTALDLYRGPLLGEVASEHLHARIAARFEEARLATVDRYAAAELSLGRPEQAIGALVDIALVAPVHQGLVGLLMTAYAQAGRVAEALAAYRAARQLLVAELGVEPGEELRRLHRQILRNELGPAVGGGPQASAGRAGGAEPAAPRELPPAPARFVGRDGDLAAITAALTGGDRTDRARVVTLHGPGGAGKSALAVVAAHTVADRFPDGQVYIDLCGSTPGVAPLGELDALGHALRSLGGDMPRTVTEAAARLRTRLADRRVLLVLDNAADAALVGRLIPSAGGCAVVVTSRTRYAAIDADVDLPLHGLTDADATRLLRHHAGRTGPDEDVARIVALCDRMPLALRLAAARLALAGELAFGALADRLDDQRRRLDELDVQGVAVRSSIQLSHDALAASDEPADRLAAVAFAGLGLLPLVDTSADYVSALLGVDGQTARDALDRLVACHLARPLPGDRYAMHDLIRLYAVEQAAGFDPAEAEAARSRALDHYLATALRAHELLRPGRTPVLRIGSDPTVTPLESASDANEWLTAQLPNLVAAAEARDGGLFPLMVSMGVGWLVAKRGEWHTELRLANLAVPAAETFGNDGDIAHAWRARAWAHLHLEAVEEARVDLERSLAAAHRAGDRNKTYGALLDLGYAASLAGDYDTAIARLTEVLEGSRSAGLTAQAATVLYNLGIVHVQQGDLGRARQVLAESLEIRRTFGDSAGLTVVLPLLGQVRLVTGDPAGARECFDEAIEVCRKLDNRVDGWFAMLGRAVVRLLDGEARPALVDIRAAWRLCTPEHTYQIAATLRAMAIAARRAGHPGLAEAYEQRADAAYAGLTARIDENMEAMLALV